MGDDNNFEFTPYSSADLEIRRKKLWRVAVVFGGMVTITILLAVGLICYSFGYHQAEQYYLDHIKSLSENQNTSTSEITGNAAKYWSSDMLDDGQIPDHYRGSDSPEVTVIEYADYPCSHCANLASEIEEVYDKYGDSVRFVFRHYNVGFTYSNVTARIAEAAYLTGGEDAYWQMQELLFNDSTWAQSDYMDSSVIEERITNYANSIGIDVNQTIDAYHNSSENGIDDKIARDNSFGNDSSITSTPSVFINGKSVSPSVDTISVELDSLLGK